IVNRALEKDRDLRYQTAGDFRAELKRLKRELDSTAIKSGINTSGATAGKRAGLILSKPLLAAAVILVLSAVLAVWLLIGRNKIEPSPWLAARSTQVTDFPHEEFFPSLSPDGNTIVYARRTGNNWDIFSQRVGGFNAQNLTEKLLRRRH